jgi:O-antigen ligase
MKSFILRTKNILTLEIELNKFMNILMYSIILIMPFIVVNFGYPRYVIGKIIFLYFIFILEVITFIKMRDFKINKIQCISLLFLLSIFIPSIFSNYKFTAFFGNVNRCEGFFIYALYIFNFIIASKFINVTRKSVNIVLVAASVMAAYGIIQFFGIDPIQQWSLGKISVPHAIGTIGNRNFLSSYLCIFLFISVAGYIFIGKKNYLIYSIILFAGLISTMTRGGWLAFVIYSFIGLLFIFKNKKQLKRALIIFIAFILVFISMNIKSGGVVFDRADSTVEIREDNTTVIRDSGRIKILKITFEAFKDRPLLGWGPDTLTKRLNDEYPELHNEHIKSQGQVVDKSHNEYLEYAVSNGIFSLAAYLTLLGMILIKLFKVGYNPISKILFLTIIGYMLQGFFNISVIMVAPIFWMFLGMSLKLVENNFIIK